MHPGAIVLGSFGLDDVHVCDTGLFPFSPMVNPMLSFLCVCRETVLRNAFRG
jgi:hypothetical protein